MSKVEAPGHALQKYDLGLNILNTNVRVGQDAQCILSGANLVEKCDKLWKCTQKMQVKGTQSVPYHDAPLYRNTAAADGLSELI